MLAPGAPPASTVAANQALAHRTSSWVDYDRASVFASTTGGELVPNVPSAIASIAVPSSAITR